MSKRLSIIFLTVAVLCIGIPTISIVADAEPMESESNVHGISYRDGSTLRIALFDDVRLLSAYPIIDWYVYHHGEFTIQDGEFTDTVTSDGLTVYTQTFEPGERHKVIITLDNGEEYIFNLTIRSQIYIDYDEIEKNPEVTMLGTDYTLAVILSYVFGAVCIVAPAFIYYKYRRKQARQEEHVL